MAERMLSVGDPVEVRLRFIGDWVSGFRVAQAVDEGYRLERISDGAVLPAVFDPRDVMPVPARPAVRWELR
jgi:hypothetical protein